MTSFHSIAAAFAVLSTFAPSARASSKEVFLPRDGAVLTRIHVGFRWTAFENLRSDYLLQIVEDDLSGHPFDGPFPILEYTVPRLEPRTTVKTGLQFGKSYAWRVRAFVKPPALPTEGPQGPANPLRVETETSRFTTQPLPAFVPSISAMTLPGVNPPEPGVTLFNLSGSALPSGTGLILGVDLAGQVVFFQQRQGGYSDLRLNPQGRIFACLPPPVLDGPGGRAVELTLDQRILWTSPDEQDKSGEDLFGVHHEAFQMENGDRLLLLRDFRVIDGRDFRGDSIVQLDRHTDQVLWSWTTFDHYSLEDVPTEGTNNWTHGNAAIYNAADNSVYFSSRNLSRITRIDYDTGSIVYNMGEESFPAGDVDFGDNLFSKQHAPQMLPNGNLMIYDNGNTIEPLSEPRQSRAIELAFAGPPSAPTSASIVWEFRMTDAFGQPVYTPFVGDADRLPGGTTLVTAGRDSTLYEADEAENLVWRLIVGSPFPQHLIYRAERVSELVIDSPGDSDGDWDLDLVDLGALQVAFTDTGPAGLSFPDTLLDQDHDDDIDSSDVSLFHEWMSGPGR